LKKALEKEEKKGRSKRKKSSLNKIGSREGKKLASKKEEKKSKA